MLKYIGPFLRMNKLNINQIQSQLLHLCRSSIKELVFNSHCGIISDPIKKDLKTSSSTDINTINLNSPLLCMYKKNSAKLKLKNSHLCWNDDKQKKDIPILSNGYMTLCILELIDYYKQFKDIDKKKYNLSMILTETAKKQLEFYGSYLRNSEGVFIDKKDCTDPIVKKLKLKDKTTGFNFTEQALLMNAFYKCSTLITGESKEICKNFSLDILKMLIDFKEELYSISFEDKCTLCLNLNIFYTYSNIEDVKPLILDVFDLLYEEYNKSFATDKVEYISLIYLNSLLLFKHTNMFKFKKIAITFNDILKKLYSEDLCIFVKNTEDKDMKFSSNEIVLYLICMICHSYFDDVDEQIIRNVFKYQLTDSGIVLSWPDVPTLDDVEHYKNFQCKAENLLDDQYFKMPNIQVPKTSELAPVFIKNVTYNKTKNCFKTNKTVFDSRINMPLFFLILHFIGKLPK